MNLVKRKQIDKAIDALKGEACNATDGYNHQYNFLWFDEVRGYRFVFGAQYYVGEYICTRAEFEARKAERDNSWQELCRRNESKHESYIQANVVEPWLKTPMIAEGSKAEQRPNHIGESDEKVIEAARIVSNAAAVSPRLAISWARRLLPDLFDNSPSDGESADWYDYDKLIATGYPKPSEIVQAFYGQNDGSGRWVECFVTGLSEHGDLVLETRGSPPGFDKWFTVDCKSKYRPFDFNRVAKYPWHEHSADPSPELSFHLSNAFNELQASARLLPEDDPRRASIVSLAGGVSAVKEVV